MMIDQKDDPSFQNEIKEIDQIEKKEDREGKLKAKRNMKKKCWR